MSTDTEDHDGLCQHNPLDDVTVQRGREAMERQRCGFEDWLLVAAALAVGRTEAMRSAHSNAPVGRRYEQEMGRWLIANGFQEIDKGARSRLLQCLEHREEIERWRATLTASERLKYNHPQTVLARWKKATVPTVPDAEPKLSPVGKLNQTIVALEEENHRMRREIALGGGDLWSRDDTNHDIARIMLTKLGPTRAKGVARELAKLAKEAVEPVS